MIIFSNIILSLLDSISRIGGTTATWSINYANWLVDWSWGQSRRLRLKCLQSIRTLKWLMSFPAARTTKAIRANRQMFFIFKIVPEQKTYDGPMPHGVRIVQLLFPGWWGGGRGGWGVGWVVCLAHLCPRHVLQKLRCREGKKFP